MKRFYKFKKKRISQFTRAKRRARKEKQVPLAKVIIIVFAIFLFLTILGFLSFLFVISYYSRDLPDVSNLNKLVLGQSSVIYDREGNELYTIHGEENRKYIPLQEVPKDFQNAIIAIEDDDFWNHQGFDLGGIAKALCYEAINNKYVYKIVGDYDNENTLAGICPRRGGSTITQQLIKMIFLTPERSYERKIKELILAYKLEQTHSKEKILEIYINTVPYGSNAYGIEKAAEIFLGKRAKDLTLAESAILASLPNAPTKYSPYLNRDNLMGYYSTQEQKYIRGRKDLVLKSMEKKGFITPEQTKKAWDESNNIVFKKYREEIKYPHFVHFVKEKIEQDDIKSQLENNIEVAGLKIFTTLDPKLQDLAEKIISEKKEEIFASCGATNAGLVAIDPKKGQILAMVGSADFYDEENQGEVNIATSLRQPGSSFKPIVYTAGFIQRYAPATVLFDVETNFGNDYKPKNFDGKYNGPVTVRYALQNSLNIPAVKMAALAGVENVIDLSKKLGYTTLQDPDQYGVSIGLGAGEVTLLEHVGAFGVLANQGKKVPIEPFLRIENLEGEALKTWTQEEGEEVLDEQTAYLISNVLSDTNSRPSYWNKYLSIEGKKVASKTGTTNKEKKGTGILYPSDCWTVGYTPDLAIGVWVGNFDGEALNAKATGLECAGPIYHDFFAEALKEKGYTEFVKPKGIKSATVEKYSGLLPSEETPEDHKISDIFASFSVPNEVSNSYKKVKIDKVTGLLANEFTPEESIEEKVFLDIHSKRPEDPNWENPVQEWVKKNFEDENEEYSANPPTEEDNFHTEETMKNKPTIKIVSPTSDASVGNENLIVITDISAKNGMGFVEYYWDGGLIHVSQYPPFDKVAIKVPESIEEGTFHRLGVKIIDKYFYSSQDEVVVKVEEDKEKPNIQIIRPAENEEIPNNSSYFVQTIIEDKKSGISRVDFFIDGIRLNTVYQEPFNASINVSLEKGAHNFAVRAFDSAGNAQIVSRKIEIVDERSQTFNETLILSPEEGDYFNKGENISIRAQISDTEKVEATQVSINTQIGKEWITIAQFNNPKGNIFDASFLPEKEGTYEIYIKVSKENKNPFISRRISIKVGE